MSRGKLVRTLPSISYSIRTDWREREREGEREREREGEREREREGEKEGRKEYRNHNRECKCQKCVCTSTLTSLRKHTTRLLLLVAAAHSRTSTSPPGTNTRQSDYIMYFK